VTIHYDGPLSKRPNRQACTQRSPQALAETWQATDCSQCFVTLLGMPVVSATDANATGAVADLVPGESVTVQWSTPTSDGSDPEPNVETVNVSDFESAWRSGVA
jgi:hypothetical protein